MRHRGEGQGGTKSKRRQSESSIGRTARKPERLRAKGNDALKGEQTKPIRSCNRDLPPLTGGGGNAVVLAEGEFGNVWERASGELGIEVSPDTGGWRLFEQWRSSKDRASVSSLASRGTEEAEKL